MKADTDTIALAEQAKRYADARLRYPIVCDAHGFIDDADRRELNRLLGAMADKLPERIGLLAGMKTTGLRTKGAKLR